MAMTETGRYGQPTRRGAIALLGSTAVIALSAANAQEVVIPAPIPEPFSFETLKAMMEERATRPDTPPAPLENFLADLDYDGYRNIRFRGNRARWGEIPVAFQIHAFHPGWLYQEA
ncbi:MAG: glucan biosynthesis protein, partial [Pseudomonadota bacterium]